MSPEARSPQGPDLNVHHATICNDSYCYDNVLYGVLQFMGYRISVKEGEVDTPRKPQLKVLVDSEETSEKLRIINENLPKETVTLLVDVEDGMPGCLLSHAEEGFVTESSVIDPCFMQAFEREKEPHATDAIAIYRELSARGVRPIDPEAMGLLLIPGIMALRRDLPFLNP